MTAKGTLNEKVIAKSAAHLFGCQGYHGTSTMEIAQLAGVSKNTLFRHFESKKNLFWYSLRVGMETVKFQLGSYEGARGGDSPKVAFQRITSLVVNSIKSSPEVFRLMAIASIELQGDIEALCCEVFSPILEELSECLAEQAGGGSGAIIKVDPSVLAASLAIALLHPKLSNLPIGNSLPPIDLPAGAQGYSKFWHELLNLGPSVPESKIQLIAIPASS